MISINYTRARSPNAIDTKPQQLYFTSKHTVAFDVTRMKTHFFALCNGQRSSLWKRAMHVNVGGECVVRYQGKLNQRGHQSMSSFVDTRPTKVPAHMISSALYSCIEQIDVFKTASCAGMLCSRDVFSKHTYPSC